MVGNRELWQIFAFPESCQFSSEVTQLRIYGAICSSFSLSCPCLFTWAHPCAARRSENTS